MTPLMTSWITGTSNHLAFPVLKHGAAVRERRLEQELEPVALFATSAEPAKRLAPLPPKAWRSWLRPELPGRQGRSLN